MLEVLDEGNEGDKQQNPEDNLKGEENDCGGTSNGQGGGCGRPPHHVRGFGGMGGQGSACTCGDMREYNLDPPRPPNILN